MKKYLKIFTISLTQEFAYKLNFVMWRVRNVMSILLIFFLWDTVFADPQRVIFGYDRSKILTYVFGLIFIKSIVLSIRSIDVAGEISRGDISNILLKPVSYFKYWFTRDLSSKTLNLIFSVFEVAILYYLLKPPFYFQSNLVIILTFILSLVMAMILYFLLVILFSTPPFWMPHQAWGFMFLLIVVGELLGGGVFPVDVLPKAFQGILYITPFPYLLFVPLEVYLGNFDLMTTFRFLLTSLLWILFLIVVNKKLWRLGLKAYRAEGR